MLSQLDGSGPGILQVSEFLKLYEELAHFGVEDEEMYRMSDLMQKMGKSLYDTLTLNEFGILMSRLTSR